MKTRVPIKQELLEHGEVLERAENFPIKAEQPMIIDDQVLVQQEQLEHGEVLENADYVVKNTKNVIENDENAASISDEIEQPMIIDQDQVPVKLEPLIEHAENVENVFENVENLVLCKEELIGDVDIEDLTDHDSDDSDYPSDQEKDEFEYLKLPDPKKYIRQCENVKMWQCLLCFASKPCKKVILRHVKTHKSCDECGKGFPIKANGMSINLHLKQCRGYCGPKAGGETQIPKKVKLGCPLFEYFFGKIIHYSLHWLIRYGFFFNYLKKQYILN
jgi:hypothetical protein